MLRAAAVGAAIGAGGFLGANQAAFLGATGKLGQAAGTGLGPEMTANVVGASLGGAAGSRLGSSIAPLGREMAAAGQRGSVGLDRAVGTTMSVATTDVLPEVAGAWVDSTVSSSVRAISSPKRPTPSRSDSDERVPK